MILILLLWSLILFIFYVVGFSIVILISKITRQFEVNKTVGFDESFFIGFLTISSLAGLLSIFIPIGSFVLISVCIIALFLFLINRKQIQINVKLAVKRISILNKPELFLLAFIVLFILTAVVNKITLGDTESYHAQSIQWIRNYAVVPGLGNIHGRLAFNSMFFVISGLFTFQIKEILIFPLNGISYIVLIIKLISLYKKEYVPGNRWKAVFYLLILLISLLIFISDLNSPSPDIICAILIIYSFTFIINLSEEAGQLNFVQIMLLNMVVFSCVTFKISSLFLVSIIILSLNKNVFNRGLITTLIGILVISPFIVRNYFLSGYVIYPFPSIDIFNVDWKIPIESVKAMKLEIEVWAKIWNTPYTEVIKLKISDWILPWFKLLSFNDKLILSINLFSVVTFIIMLFKKDFYLAKIQLVIFINLAFWFFLAPDPRFAYGFLFVGFSFTFAYLIKLFEYSNYSGMLKYINICLACFLFLIVCRRIMFPIDTLRNPSLWIISSPFGTVDTKDYYSGFHYRVPVPEGGCYNVEIPCVPFPLSNIVMRGEDLQDGFKVEKQQP
jgi:hypothetical protein